ncbi:MAG: SWIM zinc finger family protein [Anaerolineaceae bacterium]|nr:SWIM zinc finger family protein [Anaerolineaceae bacterium]
MENNQNNHNHSNNGNNKKPKSNYPKNKDKKGKKKGQQQYTGPRKVSGGIRMRNVRSDAGHNWWAQRWIHSMENLVDINRLRRGRYYARQGQVLSIEEGDAEIIAKVQGSRPKPYVARISMVSFSNEEWEKLLNVLSGRAIFAAQLLSGQMPTNIEDAFAEAGVSLFPNRAGDLLTDCTCPDWANPCKHVAATHYILGDLFDDDPFLLFRLRGRTQEQIIEGLRRHRLGEIDETSAEAAELIPQSEEVAEEDLPPESQPLEFDDSTLNEFWQNEDDLRTLSINITAPEITFPIFKRLGEPDAAGSSSLQEMLGNAYLAVSQAAQIIAFTGGDLDDDEE